MADSNNRGKGSQKFWIINFIRVVITAANLAVVWFYYSALLFWSSVIFLILALLWLGLTAARFISNELEVRLALVPAFLDIVILTLFTYYTGGIHSFGVVVYLFIVSLTSTNVSNRQGLFALVFSVVLFTSMAVAVYTGMLPQVNLLGEVTRVTGIQTLIYSFWFVATMTAAHLFIRKISLDLLQARLVAEQSARSKSEFLANMSHEIRTPMNAILGMAQVLEGTSLSDDQRTYVSIFKKNSKYLLNLLNDILDLSKIESSGLQVDCVEFSLYELLDQVSETFSHAMAEKELSFEVIKDPRAFDRVSGDPLRLRQVISNIVGNALKFTDRGSITVSLTSDGSDTVITVIDSGIGIDEQKLKAVFDKFVQADSSMTRKFGGTGLGLAISNNLVSLMGGKITVSSTPDSGSQFTVRIPLATHSCFPAHNQYPLNEKSILFTGDTESIERMTVAHLENWGAAKIKRHKVTDPGQGAGEHTVVFFNADERPAWQSNAVIRAQQNGQTLIAFSKQVSELQIPVQGADIRVLKLPVNTAELYSELLKLNEASAQVTATSAQTQSGPENTGALQVNRPFEYEQQPRILLVEDLEENRLLIELFLAEIDLDITLAENGLEGYREFCSGNFNLIFMDIQMPVMDGLTAVEKIRKYENENGLTPAVIVALSAGVLEEEIDASKKSGCDFYLTKPLEKEKLHSFISRFMSGSLAAWPAE